MKSTGQVVIALVWSFGRLTRDCMLKEALTNSVKIVPLDHCVVYYTCRVWSKAVWSIVPGTFETACGFYLSL